MNRLHATRPIQNLVPESEKIVKLEFQTSEEFDTWMKSECSTIKWRKHDGKIRARKPGALEVGLSQLNRLVYTDVHSMVIIGCQASIKVRKEINDNTIFVTYNKEHIGHQVNSAEDWKKQRLPPVLRTWL